MTRETLALGLAGMLTAAMAGAAPIRSGMVGMAPPEAEITRIADSYAAAMNRGDAAAMAAI
jgi:hypothetical protein